MSETQRELLALDRASVRRIDKDGHLHIETSPITKCAVNPYYGREIVDWERLGLDANRIYQVFRPPEELERAADSFNGKPLLIVHRPQTADDHEHSVVVGSVSNVRWEPPYLRAEMSVWSADAISGIESGERRELSACYRYRPDPTPGEYNGTKYHIAMRDLHGNHVTLVPSGRAGPDVFVGDAALSPPEPPEPTKPVPEQAAAEAAAVPVEPEPPVVAAAQDAAPAPHKTQEITMAKNATPLSRTALLASGALRAYLRPKLAADAALDPAPLVTRVTKANWRSQKPKLKAALAAAVQGKLAADEDLEDVQDVLDDLDEVVDELTDTVEAAVEEAAPAEVAATDADGDLADRLLEFLTDKLSPEDLEAVRSILGRSGGGEGETAEDATKKLGRHVTRTLVAADARPAGNTDMPETVTKAAMDAAIAAATSAAATKAARDAETATIARLRAIQAAEREVRPFIGDLFTAQDSAAAVYKLALDEAGIDLTDVPEVAYGAVLRALPKPGDEQKQSARPAAARVAMDAKAVEARQQRFPNANRLGAQ